MRNLMICKNSIKNLAINESEKKNGKYILEGIFATLGKKNRNDRIYGKEEYLKHLQYLRNDIKNGESLLGELDHPEDRFEVKVKEASHRIIDLWYDEQNNNIMGKIELLNTPNGKIAQALVDQGVPLHISSRAAGSVNPDNTVNIQQIYTYDIVAKPGFAEAVLHRVNESEGTTKYSDDVYGFLKESERKDSLNAAPQFGYLNEDMSITEIPSEVKLRNEAKQIQEDNNMEIKDNTTPLVEEEEEKKDDDTEVKDNDDNGSDDNGGDDNNDSGDAEDDFEIISIDIETSDDEDNDDDTDGESKDDENGGDDDNKDDEDSDKSDDDNNGDDDKKDDDTNECDGATSECGDSCKKEDSDDENSKHDPEKEMILDCKEIKDRKEKFQDKIEEFVDAYKKKNADKKANESNIIDKYPISSLLNESEFASFVSLDESKKNKVISYLKDKNLTSRQAVNENWRNGIDYEPENEVWMKYAPTEYRELYEAASEDVKNSIKNTASYLLFENQYDVNHFWESTGLMEASSNNLMYENFINNVPKIGEINESTNLPYSKEFIDTIADMAKAYN